MTIQKATEQYFPAVLFIMLNKVVLTLESVDERMTIQMKATEQYSPVVLFIMLYEVVLTFESESVDEPFKRKLLSSTFMWCCLLCCIRRSSVWMPKV